MGWHQRLNLLNGILFVSGAAIVGLDEWILEGSSQALSGPDAILFLITGIFLLTVSLSSRARKWLKTIGETTAFQSIVFVVGLAFLLFASVLLYDVATLSEPRSRGYYIRSVFWLGLIGVAGGSLTYSAGRERFAPVDR